MVDFARINMNKGQVLTQSQLHHVCRKAFDIIDTRGLGSLLKEEVKEFIVFARENIYMNTPQVSQDGVPQEAISAEQFELFWKALPI